MISEIVRSRANIDSGARTRQANAWHGLFLQAAVLAAPSLLHEIPLAALGGGLVFTGFRLANPGEFIKTYQIGGEQFVVFVGTILVTLATDLLVGIAAGVALELAFHLWNGVPLRGLLWSDVSAVADGDRRVMLLVRRAATFASWLGLRKAIVLNAAGKDEVVVGLSRTRLVDHSVMEKLRELEREFAAAGKVLKVAGLDAHRPLSPHPLAARKRPADVATLSVV